MRIVSDGTPEGTHVYENGREVRGVTSVKWSLATGGKATAVIEVVGVEIEATAEAPQHLVRVIRP